MLSVRRTGGINNNNNSSLAARGTAPLPTHARGKRGCKRKKHVEMPNGASPLGAHGDAFTGSASMAVKGEDKYSMVQATLGGEHLWFALLADCLLYTSPSPRDRQKSRMPSSA